jgi:hypothetical protein
MCTTAQPVSVSAFAHASCRIAPFRRYRVSKVCYCGGVLLVFAASKKVPQRLSAEVDASIDGRLINDHQV